jgi:hypothetical protein
LQKFSHAGAGAPAAIRGHLPPQIGERPSTRCWPCPEGVLIVPLKPWRRQGTIANTMCRNIKTLFNFEPPATELEIRDASLQFVRKLSGFNLPSKANEAAFNRAVEDVAAAARVLVQSLVTTAEPRNREIEAMKAKERSIARFGNPKEQAPD